ncbi:6291_t:CDS:2 [Ambispora gerdemannii]|uniref:6291_t:CDS:1 n=1 Tax=Ambispora gerdemannii TaxID=144530 RepID=A0A9N9BQ74_9GLOM|nr:6291_t:CDS:2 [Ambispora gerdemannii]
MQPDSTRNLPFNSEILDHSTTKDLHFEILCEQISIDLDIHNLKPTAQLISVVETALNSKTPIEKLENVYNNFGHLIPTKVIIGNKLKRIVCFPENQFDEKIKGHEFVKFSEKENELLKSWREDIRPFDSSYMLAMDCMPVEISRIPDWLEYNKRNKLDWRIIKLFTVPLHKILDIAQQKKIEYLYQKQDCILMIGKNLIADYDAGYLQIEFESVLKSANYHLFGVLVDSDNAKLTDVFVRFSLKTVLGFSVSWHDFRKNYNQKIDELNIECENRAYFLQWILIGSPIEIGYTDPAYRHLTIKFGVEKIKLTLDNVIELANSEDIPPAKTWIANINIDKVIFPQRNLILFDTECDFAPSIFFFNSKIVSWREYGLIRMHLKTMNEEDYEFIEEYKGLEVRIRYCVLFFENESLVDSVLWNTLGHLLPDQPVITFQ